jgi:hypothetical protein
MFELGGSVKNAAFWDVILYGSREIRNFGGTLALSHQDEDNQRARNNVSSN